MSYAITPTIGIDLTQIGQGAETAQKLLPAYALGTKAIFNDGVYQYCKAAGTVAAGDLVKISPEAGAYTFVSGTTTLLPSTEPAKVGVATLAFTSGQYGWIFVGPGLVSVFCETSCAQDVKLYTHATAGHVDDTATTLINGLKLITTITTAAVSPCVAECELSTVIA